MNKKNSIRRAYNSSEMLRILIASLVGLALALLIYVVVVAIVLQHGFKDLNISGIN